MSTAPQLTDPIDHGPLQADLVLNSWPVRDEPDRGWTVLASQLVTAVIVWWVVQDLALTLAACGALAGAMWRDLLPTTYVIGANGITQQIHIGPRRSIRQRRMAWSAMGQCKIHNLGVVFFRQRDYSPIERLCGIFVPFQGHRAELLRAIRRYAAQANISDANSSTVKT